MKFDLKNEHERKAAQEYLDELKGKELVAEVIRVSPKRSLKQNNYLYLLFEEFRRAFGWDTIDEVKTTFKRDINPQTFVYEKNGGKFLRSTAELDTEEMTRCIDRFREWAATNGHPLPAATDQEWLRQIENEAERERFYLK